MEKPKDISLAGTLEEALCDPGLIPACARLIDYDQRWGGRSPKGPPPADAVKEAERARAAVRDAVAARLAGGRSRPGLDERGEMELQAILVARLESRKDLIASLGKYSYYQGFTTAGDLPYLARVAVQCLRTIGKP